MRTAVYAGSFDPITRGHEDLIRRSLAFVDRIVVAVATNVSKQPLFTLEERVGFIREAVGKDERVEVRQFNGLLVDFAKSLAARGVEIISTGGTAKALEAAGVPVLAISDVTGFPEM